MATIGASPGAWRRRKAVVIWAAGEIKMMGPDVDLSAFMMEVPAPAERNTEIEALLLAAIATGEVLCTWEPIQLAFAQANAVSMPTGGVFLTEGAAAAIMRISISRLAHDQLPFQVNVSTEQGHLIPTKAQATKQIAEQLAMALGCRVDELDIYSAKGDAASYKMKGNAEGKDVTAKPLVVSQTCPTEKAIKYILNTADQTHLVTEEVDGRLVACNGRPTITVRLGASVANAKQPGEQGWIAQKMSDKTLDQIHPRSARVLVEGGIEGLSSVQPMAVIRHMLLAEGRRICAGKDDDKFLKLRELQGTVVAGVLDCHMEPAPAKGGGTGPKGAAYYCHWRTPAAAAAFKAAGHLSFRAHGAWLRIVSLDAYPDGVVSTPEQRTAWPKQGLVVQLTGSRRHLTLSDLDKTIAGDFVGSINEGFAKVVQSAANSYAKKDKTKQSCLVVAGEEKKKKGIKLPAFVGRDGLIYSCGELIGGEEQKEILHHVTDDGSSGSYASYADIGGGGSLPGDAVLGILPADAASFIVILLAVGGGHVESTDFPKDAAGGYTGRVELLPAMKRRIGQVLSNPELLDKPGWPLALALATARGGSPAAYEESFRFLAATDKKKFVEGAKAAAQEAAYHALVQPPPQPLRTDPVQRQVQRRLELSFSSDSDSDMEDDEEAAKKQKLDKVQ